MWACDIKNNKVVVSHLKLMFYSSNFQASKLYSKHNSVNFFSHASGLDLGMAMWMCQYIGSIYLVHTELSKDSG